jgi:hypothetical protein
MPEKEPSLPPTPADEIAELKKKVEETRRLNAEKLLITKEEIEKAVYDWSDNAFDLLSKNSYVIIDKLIRDAEGDTLQMLDDDKRQKLQADAYHAMVERTFDAKEFFPTIEIEWEPTHKMRSMTVKLKTKDGAEYALGALPDAALRNVYSNGETDRYAYVGESFLFKESGFAKALREVAGLTDKPIDFYYEAASRCIAEQAKKLGFNKKP